MAKNLNSGLSYLIATVLAKSNDDNKSYYRKNSAVIVLQTTL